MKIFNKSNRKFVVKDGDKIVEIQPKRFVDLSDKLAKSLLDSYHRDLAETDDLGNDENAKLKKRIAELEAEVAKKETKAKPKAKVKPEAK